MELITPDQDRLPLFIAAMERSLADASLEQWYAREQLRLAVEEPALFLAQATDMEGIGTVTLADGRQVPRLPGFTRWMWDDELAGMINFRWQTGTTDLPPNCLGHIGYETLSWKRQRGYATQALAQMLDLVRPLGIAFVELVTNIDNIASQQVVKTNGGVLVEEFDKPESSGGGCAYRFRIDL